MNSLILAIFIGITVLLNTMAQTLLKLGSGQAPLNLYLVAGLGSYGISTAFYIAVLGKLDLSFVYPIVIGLTIVGSIISGWLLLHESTSAHQLFGMVLMIGGLLIFATSKA